MLLLNFFIRHMPERNCQGITFLFVPCCTTSYGKEVTAKDNRRVLCCLHFVHWISEIHFWLLLLIAHTEAVSRESDIASFFSLAHDEWKSLCIISSPIYRTVSLVFSTHLLYWKDNLNYILLIFLNKKFDNANINLLPITFPIGICRKKVLQMIKYLSILWICIYIYTVMHYLFEIIETNSVINTLEKYLSSAQMSSYGHLTLSKNYSRYQNKLLFCYPKIINILGLYTPTLDYGFSNEKNYSNAKSIYNEILMHKNFLIFNLKSSFNPITSLKKLFSMPSTLINWLGFKPKDTISKFFNLIGWILAYFLNVYSEEIKALIHSFFQQWLNA